METDHAAHPGECRELIESPIGPLLVVAGGNGLRTISFDGSEPSHRRISDLAEGTTDGRRVRAPRSSGDADRTGGDALDHLGWTLDQLEQYFAGRLRKFDLELDSSGTPFQVDVWRTLTRIPYGETRTYGEVARLIGRPEAARAVGAANGANPIAIVVPCHRVIGTNGSLTGYGGGQDRKRWLLDHESGEHPLPMPAPGISGATLHAGAGPHTGARPHTRGSPHRTSFAETANDHRLGAPWKR